jgi:hypothetical protein
MRRETEFEKDLREWLKDPKFKKVYEKEKLKITNEITKSKNLSKPN